MILKFRNSQPYWFAITVIFSLLIINGCHRSGNESSGPDAQQEVMVNPVDFDLDKIRERGHLIAIIDNSSTGFFLYKGQSMGYEYDLLTLYAKHIGVTLEIKSTTNISRAFEMLNSGEGDVIAYNLTVTKARKKIVAFTNSHYTTRQVLVQQKPNGWRDMTAEQINKSLIRNQVNLIGKEVHVRKSSSYVDRLQNLSDEIGNDIIIIEDRDSAETEELIKKVAFGDISYTVADESVALVSASYYPDIDVKTPISFPQQIAWAVRKNSPDLMKSVNTWLRGIKREPTFNIIFNKYFRSPRASMSRVTSDFSSLGIEKKISIYDDQIKLGADTLNWDWRLLAAQIYQESHFDPEAKSWAGAIGLMQLMPETGHRFGAVDLLNPDQSIKAGVSHLVFLDNLWAKTIEDKEERIKFVLSSYNVGLGHVIDARQLAKKYGKDPLRWDGNVEHFLLLKTKPQYFRDPVVKSGYCRGEEPVNYVKEILSRYKEYKQLINS